MSNLITYCQESAVHGMELFLTVFSHTPDDKLDWTPAPGAKSSLQIAAHTAVTAGNFATMLRDRRIPKGDEIPAMLARLGAEEQAITDRAIVEEVFRANTHQILDLLGGLSPEDIEITLDSGMGWTMPMTFLMKLPGIHAYQHTSQLDYLQTCWGDKEVHF